MNGPVFRNPFVAIYPFFVTNLPPPFLGITMKRLSLTALCIAALCAVSWRPVDALEPELGVGSAAPALDVEHWIQDGNGFFQPVTEFEPGRVYVVEFWATWCGPCVASMPHLAELQQKYRGQNVHIISISDESLAEVQEFLERKHPQTGKPFSEITAAYSLTTDPDGSSHEAYMAAAQQQGIPAAFLVGKTGVIEWIGHPMELDEPLEAVVNDSWDREAYRRQLEMRQRMERLRAETMQEVSQLLGGDRVEEAITLLETRIAQAENEQIAASFRDLLYQVKLSTGRVDEATLAHYRDRLNAGKGNPIAVGQFAFMIHGAMQQGVDPGPLAEEAVVALTAEIPQAEQRLKPTLYIVLAQLHAGTGDLSKAVAAMEQGVDASEGPQKERLQEMLDDLKLQAEAAKN